MARQGRYYFVCKGCGHKWYDDLTEDDYERKRIQKCRECGRRNSGRKARIIYREVIKPIKLTYCRSISEYNKKFKKSIPTRPGG